MNVTPAQLRALQILQRHGPLTPHYFARKMWPDSPAWKHSVKCGPSGSHRGGGMYLAGGGYLGKLAHRGLAKRLYRPRFGKYSFVGYVLDTRGRQVLKLPKGSLLCWQCGREAVLTRRSGRCRDCKEATLAGALASDARAAARDKKRRRSI